MGKSRESKFSHPYNDPSKWATAGIYRRPDFDVEAYQRKLDEIVGLSASGQSIVVLRWAWECRRWQNYEWDEWGNATQGEWRQKYKAITLNLGEDEYVDISPPRWCFEQRFEPGQYEASWDSSRWVHDPKHCRRCQNQLVGLLENSTTCTRRDIWGEMPRDGWYNLLDGMGIIAEHSNHCCDRAWEESRQVCYGNYKLPSQLELNRLRRAVSKRNADFEVNPHQTLTPADLERARIWGMQRADEMQVDDYNELKQMYKDEVTTHGASILPAQALWALRERRMDVPVHKTWIT